MTRTAARESAGKKDQPGKRTRDEKVCPFSKLHANWNVVECNALFAEASCIWLCLVHHRDCHLEWSCLLCHRKQNGERVVPLLLAVLEQQALVVLEQLALRGTAFKRLLSKVIFFCQCVLLLICFV